MFKNRTCRIPKGVHKVSYGMIWDKADKVFFAVSRLKKS